MLNVSPRAPSHYLGNNLEWDDLPLRHPVVQPILCTVSEAGTTTHWMPDAKELNDLIHGGRVSVTISDAAPFCVVSVEKAK